MAGPWTHPAVDRGRLPRLPEQVAADENVDAVIAVAVPTAIADLRPAGYRRGRGQAAGAAALLARSGCRGRSPARRLARRLTQRSGHEQLPFPLAGGAAPPPPAARAWDAYPEGATRRSGHAARTGPGAATCSASLPELNGDRTEGGPVS